MDMSADRIALLKAVPLFRGLGTSEMKAVLETAQEVDHSAGREIVGEGQSGIGFHLILSGEVKVSQQGHELTVLRPGEDFGEVALIDGQGRSASVTAVGPVRTLSIVACRFEPLLHQHPLIAIAFLKEFCARLRRAEASIVR
jgi:CRP/FNR family transcriptional regulator, cyclic AMP receptor protein